MDRNKKAILNMLSARKKQSEIARDRARNHANSIPALERTIAMTESLKSAFENIPDDPNFPIPENLVKTIKAENDFFDSNYEDLLKGSQFREVADTSVGVSGMTGSRDYFYHHTQNSHYQQMKYTWAEENIYNFAELFSKQKRLKDTANMLNKLNPGLSHSFNNLTNDVLKLKSNIAKSEDLAFRMRTIMEKVKGELNVKILAGMQVKANLIFDSIAKKHVDNDITSPTYIY